MKVRWRVILEYKDGLVTRINATHIVSATYRPRNGFNVAEIYIMTDDKLEHVYRQDKINPESWDNLLVYIGVPDTETEKGNENG
jgi:hypothetical protein